MIRRSVALLGLLAAVVLSGCASDDWEGRYNDTQRSLLDVAAERDQARADYARAVAEQEALSARANQTERELAAANERTQTAIQRAKELQDALDAYKNQPQATPADSAAKLEDIRDKLERSSGVPTFVTADGNIELRLSSDITFGSGKTDLTKGGKDVLRRIAPRLTNEFSTYDIRVEGHTDNEPLKKTKDLYGDNRGLGSARANSVARYLESEFSIRPERIATLSKGETEPIASNATKEGRAKNRRVAIIVVMPHETVDAMGK